VSFKRRVVVCWGSLVDDGKYLKEQVSIRVIQMLGSYLDCLVIPGHCKYLLI
jgi:hypothetical protein